MKKKKQKLTKKQTDRVAGGIRENDINDDPVSIEPEIEKDSRDRGLKGVEHPQSFYPITINKKEK